MYTELESHRARVMKSIDAYLKLGDVHEELRIYVAKKHGQHQLLHRLLLHRSIREMARYVMKHPTIIFNTFLEGYQPCAFPVLNPFF